jgi:mannosyltransferase OCH1-like enzyme
MIPRVIHYIWFGNRPKIRKIEKCINSWKRFCPDYKIIEWNETNFDVNSHPFAKEAYEAGNYAFVSDVARLMILYEYGGIYVDADVEILKSIDELLNNNAFIGIETNEYVNSGQMFGTVKNNPLIKEHLEQYDNLSFKKCEDITEITCPKLLTKLLIDKGFKTDGSEQIIEGLHIFPQDYFNPFDSRTGKMLKTENSYSVHWSAHSWVSQSRFGRNFVRICHRLFGINCFNWIKQLIQ